MPIISAINSSFIDDNASVVNAIVIFAAALILARGVDWFVVRNGVRVRESMVGEELSQSALTRLRLIRRLLFAAIVLVGLGIALNQIDALRPLSTSLLASSAVAGIVIGMAARQTLANGVAGMMLATVQPFRIGDVIEWDGHRGRVEDITLTYTYVRLPSGHRLVVPNERIAAGPIENFTITGSNVEADIALWLRPQVVSEALPVLREAMPDNRVGIGAVEFDRVELTVSFSVPASEEAALRAATCEQAIGLLDRAGILEGGNQAP